MIASELDEKFNPVHLRQWNLAAICLLRVNPKKQRRPTFTAKEMTTLLSKAEGQFLVLYFFCAVTGMRVSEAIAIEIDKHIELDCSIIYVRQQREKHVNRVKKLQRSEARQILIDHWMGHVSSSMGDRYGKQLVEDVEYRQQQVRKVGLGFELPPSLLGLRSGLQIAATVAA